MASIPGWVYLIIGIFIAGVSKLNPNSNEGFFRIFLIIGAIFAFVGVIKIIFGSGGKKEKMLSNPNIIHAQTQQQAQQPVQPMQPQPVQQPNNVILCPRCRSNNYSNAKYCQMCGLRLK